MSKEVQKAIPAEPLKQSGRPTIRRHAPPTRGYEGEVVIDVPGTCGMLLKASDSWTFRIWELIDRAYQNGLADGKPLTENDVRRILREDLDALLPPAPPPHAGRRMR